jgi:hypothetical protein
MRAALYYPHTEIRSESLIRSALLTWDRLEYIVPYQGYTPHYDNRDIAEAVELIGAPVAPSDLERRAVHDQLEELIAKGVPEPFRYNGDGMRGQDYEMWPQKLLPETWRMLREHAVIGELLDNADYPATQGGGLTIMAMIADVMAGETRARVTDRGLAYATLANVAKPADPAAAAPNDIAQVVPLTFKSLALEHVGLNRLVAFRKREEKSGGHDFRTLRHAYVDRLEKHLAEASKHPAGSRDRKELDRIFEQEMEDDLLDLKRELGLAKSDLLLSKDTITFVLAGAGLVGAALAAKFSISAAVGAIGGPAAIGGVIGVSTKFGAKRREVLRKHPMAYLYEVEA